MTKTEINKYVREYLKAGAYQDALDVLTQVCEPQVKVRGPNTVYEQLKKYASSTKESFFCLILDGANNIVSVEKITTGLVNRTLVHPREVFKPAIIKSAQAIIIAHNHPSGDTNPSEDDMNVTKRLTDAGGVLGISVIDHVIFSRRGYYSFSEEGRI